MSESPSSLSGWTPEQIAQAKRWVETWKQAGPELERIRREEFIELEFGDAVIPVRERPFMRRFDDAVKGNEFSNDDFSHRM